VEDYRDDADAAQDLEPPSEPATAETPEADALEQAAEVDPTIEDEPAAVGDAPEADALEQRRPLGGDPDADDRR
jgi:hypothetical protein